jgi:hypothetical protein
VFHGPVRIPADEHISDLSAREIVGVVPVLAAILVIGIYPRPFLERIEPSVQAVIHHVEGRSGGALPRFDNEPSTLAVSEDPPGTVDAYGRAVVPPFASPMAAAVPGEAPRGLVRSIAPTLADPDEYGS